MSEATRGIHHVTAIAGDAQQNVDFYTGILGLRMVKQTVNFDDPGTYHLYYGDDQGRPGTIMTFFPWKGAPRGSLSGEEGPMIPEEQRFPIRRSEAPDRVSTLQVAARTDARRGRHPLAHITGLSQHEGW